MEQPEPATVLVMDDEADWRELLKELLETEGYRVAAAEHGSVAAQRLQSLAAISSRRLRLPPFGPRPRIDRISDARRARGCGNFAGR